MSAINEGQGLVALPIAATRCVPSGQFGGESLVGEARTAARGPFLPKVRLFDCTARAAMSRVVGRRVIRLTCPSVDGSVK